MANQIQKKFILDGAVDGLKLKLLKDQAVVGTKQDGSVVDIIKLGLNDEVLVKGVEVGLKSQVDQSLVDAKAYADQKITDLVNGAPTALDTLKELADQLASDQTALSGILVTLDTKAATTYVDSQDEAKLVEAKSYTDAQIAAIPAVDISGKADKTYVDTQDGQVLVDAKAYVDAQIAAIPPVDISGKADITYVDSQVSVLDGRIDVLEAAKVTIEGDLSNLDGYAQDIRSDLDAAILAYEAADLALDGRLDVLEAKKVVTFEKEGFVAASPLDKVTLAHEVLAKSLVVFVGRLALIQGEDYTVSVVDSKTVLTWAGDFAVGGIEGIEAGDKINVTYAYMA